ncbi:MAG: histidine kinase [Flavobacteriales bacterium]|nr:histidine kinase [Flavobacteriales bacterium]
MSFHDVDKDGFSEEFRLGLNHLGQGYIQTWKHGKIVDQYNFNGIHPPKPKIGFADVNRDGLEEVWLYLHQEDSLFIGCYHPEDRKLEIKGVCSVRRDDLLDYSVSSFDFLDLNSDGFFDVCFSINSGFTDGPRKIYSFDSQNNSIASSAHLGNKCRINNFQFTLGEVSLGCMCISSCNSFVDSTLRDDCSVWIPVLTDTLGLKSAPAEFNIPFGAQYSFESDSNKWIVLIDDPKDIRDAICTMDTDGQILEKISSDPYKLKKVDGNQLSFARFYDELNHELLDLSSSDIERTRLPGDALFGDVIAFDLNQDGRDEYVCTIKGKPQIKIFDTHWSNPVALEFTGDLGSNFYLNGIKGMEATTFLHWGENFILFDYRVNQLYYLTFPILFLIYTILGLLGKIAEYRIKKLQRRKEGLRKEIIALQIRGVKNQVDPHFVFNSMNAVSEMILTKESELAEEFVWKLSEFMRQTLNGSEKISHSLAEEINYVEAYMEIQRIKFDGFFEFHLEVGPGIPLNMAVPKYCLYAYLENSIKYGLTNPKGDNHLNVRILKKENKVFLILSDNGKGVPEERISARGTGSGFRIMEAIFSLYEKLEGIRIRSSLRTLKDSDGSKSGTMVEVIIPYKTSKS